MSIIENQVVQYIILNTYIPQPIYTYLKLKFSIKSENELVNFYKFKWLTLLIIFLIGRGGSGQFFCPRVGFRVFRFCSGRVSGQRNLVRVKLRSIFFAFFSQFWLYLAKNWQYFSKKLLRVTRVLEKVGRVGLAKIASGRVKSRVRF